MSKKISELKKYISKYLKSTEVILVAKKYLEIIQKLVNVYLPKYKTK